MRLLRAPGASRTVFTGTLAACVVAVGAGCGQSEERPIPASAARDIVARLDEVERRVAAGACNDVRDDSLPAIRNEIDGLPARVDAEIRSTLEDGVGRLEELVQAECDEPQVITPEPTPTPEPEPTPTPEPEPTPTPTPDPAPDNQGGGNGDGGGGDGGSGGDGAGDGGGGGGGGGGDDGGGSGFIPPGDGGTDPSPGVDPGSAQGPPANPAAAGGSPV